VPKNNLEIIYHSSKFLISLINKNIFVFLSRATVENHRYSDLGLPSVGVTIAVNEDELVFRYELFLKILKIKYVFFCFRIKDRGGGMPRQLLDKIFDYHFSSSDLSNDPSLLSYTDFDNHLYDQLVTRDNKNRMSG
jgi:hypothetical protein